MKRINKSYLLFLLLSIVQFSWGQDSLKLGKNEFLSIVKSYHPMAFRYRLQNKMAASEIQKAKGNFDPIVEAKNGSKTIDGIDYYTENSVKLGIPTWYGVDFNGSYNNIVGQKLNNSDTKGGLTQIGINVPLVKNLLYDKRRALLDQAKYAQQMTLAEQQLMTNQLLLDAENCYWEWVKQYELFLIQKQAVEVNKQRLKLIRRTFEFGERSAIDTTEAESQLLSFELQLEDARLKFVKNTQQLSLYLWTENNQAYDLTQMLVPSDKLSSSIAYVDYPALLMELKSQALQQHAAMQYYYQKKNILESERKLKQQSLLPKIDFNYNFVNKQKYQSDYFPLFQNNYQYGLKFELALFLREARADYQITKSKILQNKLDIDFKRQELTVKIANYQSETLNYSKQIGISEQNILNYRRLLYAEETRYESGESSLFLINARESKLLESEIKLLELRLKFLNSYNQLKWLNKNFSSNLSVD
jgi:outer membrane protein TolC